MTESRPTTTHASHRAGDAIRLRWSADNCTDQLTDLGLSSDVLYTEARAADADGFSS
jgi:hypothetical protein